MALPNVHYLDFSEGNSPTDDPDRFNILWQLIDVSKPPRNSSNNSDQWRGIFEGDLIVFSSLLSGAGEFEAVRFVGPKSEGDALPLLPAGIEHPVFPTLIVQVSIMCLLRYVYILLTIVLGLLVFFQYTLDGRGEGNIPKRIVRSTIQCSITIYI